MSFSDLLSEEILQAILHVAQKRRRIPVRHVGRVAPLHPAQGGENGVERSLREPRSELEQRGFAERVQLSRRRLKLLGNLRFRQELQDRIVKLLFARPFRKGLRKSNINREPLVNLSEEAALRREHRHCQVAGRGRGSPFLLERQFSGHTRLRNQVVINPKLRLQGYAQNACLKAERFNLPIVNRQLPRQTSELRRGNGTEAWNIDRAVDPAVHHSKLQGPKAASVHVKLVSALVASVHKVVQCGGVDRAFELPKLLVDVLSEHLHV